MASGLYRVEAAQSWCARASVIFYSGTLEAINASLELKEVMQMALGDAGFLWARKCSQDYRQIWVRALWKYGC